MSQKQLGVHSVNERGVDEGSYCGDALDADPAPEHPPDRTLGEPHSSPSRDQGWSGVLEHLDPKRLGQGFGGWGQ